MILTVQRNLMESQLRKNVNMAVLTDATSLLTAGCESESAAGYVCSQGLSQ
jgi:hypothetical protein